MKTTFVLLLLLSLFQFSSAQKYNAQTDTVETVKNYKNLYCFQNFYLGGHPSLEELKWLKTQGVSTIVNLRSEKENKDFCDFAFNEEVLAKDLGFAYFTVPVDGIKDYTPEKLDEVITLISKNEKILLHCAGAGRVSDFFMAYLVKSKGYTLNEAAEIGKKLKFALPLEKLLQTKISMEQIN